MIWCDGPRIIAQSLSIRERKLFVGEKLVLNDLLALESRNIALKSFNIFLDRFDSIGSESFELSLQDEAGVIDVGQQLSLESVDIVLKFILFRQKEGASLIDLSLKVTIECKDIGVDLIDRIERDDIFASIIDLSL